MLATRGVSVFHLMLLVGLFQIALYWFSGSMACSDGVIATPQYDTPLYYQAARRVAEGCPFSFSHGSTVCTGTTTVLYPFVLAIPYVLGAKGDSLLWAGFLLNALFYLIFLFGWSVAIRNWCLRFNSMLLAAVLVALSGHCAYNCFSQSDIGFLLAYTALFAAALSADKRRVLGLLLVLGPWVRPEGMICVIAYCMITGVYLVMQRFLPDLREKNSAADLVICTLAIISCLGVFALNYALTGQAQFSSVAGKGYFVQYGFAMAVYATIQDLSRMAKELFWGLPKGMPRDFVSIPGLGILLLSIGIVVYRWNERKVRGLLVFILAAFGGLLSVAQSGWQGTNLDRYVVWFFPIVILFVSESISYVESRFMPTVLRRLPSVCVVALAGIGSLSMVTLFYAASCDSDTHRLFAYDCEKLMPPGASYGTYSACGLSYYFSPRRCLHFCGIYTSEFSPKSLTENVERLRHYPELRCDYWVFSSGMIDFLGKDCAEKLGDVLLAGPDAMTLTKAKWDAFEIPDAHTYDGKTLVAVMDVGYESDEKSSGYGIITRWGYEAFDPFVQGGGLGDKFIVDVGRVILGGDELSVPLRPGVDATVVMRTWPSHVVRRNIGYPTKEIDCAFANPLKFNVAVDGNVVSMAEVTYSTNSFSDVSFKIPGVAIRNPVSRIGFLGDHITFGYWFYQ